MTVFDFDLYENVVEGCAQLFTKKKMDFATPTEVHIISVVRQSLTDVTYETINLTIITIIS